MMDLTPAQRATLTAVRDAGLQPGETFLAQTLFPARDAVDNGHRRTLARLVTLGVLSRGEPAWANNVYVVAPGAYDQLPPPARTRAPQWELER
jgi:hypothetical protein